MNTRIIEGTATAGQSRGAMALPSIAACTGRATNFAKRLGFGLVRYARDIVLAQRTRTELGALSDLELKDMGLIRTDIDAVATGAFTR